MNIYTDTKTEKERVGRRGGGGGRGLGGVITYTDTQDTKKDWEVGQTHREKTQIHIPQSVVDKHTDTRHTNML